MSPTPPRRTRAVLMGLAVALALFGMLGVALAQQEPPTTVTFTSAGTIGRPAPTAYRYDPVNERLAWLDPNGALHLVDARTMAVQRTLLEGVTPVDVAFSPDGRFVAVAVGTTVTVYDAASGAFATAFNPDGALSLAAPLTYASDGRWLLLNSVVRAPQAIRRSENDTSILPWLWDVRLALNEGAPSLPNRVSAQPFFDYRNGFVISPSDVLLGALPRALRVLTVDENRVAAPSQDAAAPSRAERDPLLAWAGLRLGALYAQPEAAISAVFGLFASDPTNALFLRNGREVAARDVASLRALADEGPRAIVGEPASLQTTPLSQRLLGEDFRTRRRTLALIDVLRPATDAVEPRLFIVVFDERTGTATPDLVLPSGVRQVAYDAVRGRLALLESAARVTVYDVATGGLLQTLAINPDDPARFLTFAPNGDVLANHQRFALADGRVLAQVPSVTGPFDQLALNSDGSRLATLRSTAQGTLWTLWDAATGQPLRQELLPDQGNIIDARLTEGRFLLQEPDALVVADLGANLRLRARLPEVPGDSIAAVVPSPTWGYVLVQYASGAQAMLTFGNQDTGGDGAMLWFRGAEEGFTGTDLVWDTPTTVLLTPFTHSTGRVIGVNYDPATTLPTCVAGAFPADVVAGFATVWEARRIALAISGRPFALDQLAVRLCDAVPAGAQAVSNVLTPPTATPGPTSPPFRPTSSVVVGAPSCLTSAYPGEALDYAEVWDALVTGLTPEEAADFEALLCEGIFDTYPAHGDVVNADDGVPRAFAQVRIDAATGARSLFVAPPPSSAGPSGNAGALALVQRAYDDQFNTRTFGGTLSADGTMFATVTNTGHVALWRVTGTARLVAAATATQAEIATQTQAAAPIVLRVAVTATPTPRPLGMPSPTITPTITRTPPPTPASVAQAQAGQVEEVCAAPLMMPPVGTLPEGWAASGRLLLDTGGPAPVVFDLDANSAAPDANPLLRLCAENTTCSLSPDRQWLWTTLPDTGALVVARSDGRDAVLLADISQIDLYDVRVESWRPDRTLRLSYILVGPETPRRPRVIIHYDPLARAFVNGPATPTPDPARDLRVNGLVPSVVVRNDNNDWAWAGVGYPVGNTRDGWLYALINVRTGEQRFTIQRERTDVPNDFEARWQPGSQALVLRDASSGTWYHLDVATGTLAQLGTDIPDGAASPDRNLVISSRPPSAEALARLAATGATQSTQIEVWHRANGLVRRYCLPGHGLVGGAARPGAFRWSPDGRTVAFTVVLPTEGDRQAAAAQLGLATPTLMPTPTGPASLGNPDVLPSQSVWLLALDIQTGQVAVLARSERPVNEHPFEVLAWLPPAASAPPFAPGTEANTPLLPLTLPTATPQVTPLPIPLATQTGDGAPAAPFATNTPGGQS